MMEKTKRVRWKWILRMGFCLALIAAMVLIGAVMVGAEEERSGDGWEWSFDRSEGVLRIYGSGAMTDYTTRIAPPWCYEDYIKDIKKIVIGENITAVGDRAFINCRYAREVIFEGNSKIERIGLVAFWGCESLETIIFGSNSNLKSIGENAFTYGHPNEVYITDIDAWCRTSFDAMNGNPIEGSGLLYVNGKLVEEVIVPDDVKELVFTFPNCKSLKKVVLPEGLETIGYSTFKGCSNLTINGIPNSVTTIGGSAFASCFMLTSVDIPNGVTLIGANAFSGCVNLVTVDMPNYLPSIGEYCFSGCKNLESITIPNGVTQIARGTFYYCSKLTRVDLPDSVRIIRTEAFMGCSSLEEVVLSKNLERIYGGAFRSCSITNVVIPASLKFIGIRAFFQCPNLQSVVFENQDGWSVSYSDNYYPDGQIKDVSDPNENAKRITDAYLDAYKSWSCATPKYTVTFIADGNIVSVETYTENDMNISIPAVPHKPGYTGVWEDFDLSNGGNITVHAIYTPTESKLTGASVSLGQSLALNYYAVLTPAHTAAQMRFTYHGETTLVSGVLDEASGEYKFTFGRIPPQCMGDNVKAELILISEDGTETVLDVKETYSVRAYCDDALAANPDNKALATLLADLLAYGDAAQDYANYNEDTPASDGFTVAPSEWEDVTDTDFTLSDKTREDLRFTSAGVRFGYINRLYFKIKAADLTGVTLTVNGKTYTAEDLIPVEDTADTYILYTDAIYATEFDKVFTAELSVDGQTVQTLTYSVKSYVYTKQNAQNSEAAALARALYKYGLSAIAYKNAQ